MWQLPWHRRCGREPRFRWWIYGFQSLTWNIRSTSKHTHISIGMAATRLQRWRMRRGDSIYGASSPIPFVYLIKQARWVHEDDTFLQPPPDTHEPEPYGDNWSDGCDQCHSVRPSYEFLADKTSGAASVVELGISCEACHGQGVLTPKRIATPWVATSRKPWASLRTKWSTRRSSTTNALRRFARNATPSSSQQNRNIGFNPDKR